MVLQKWGKDALELFCVTKTIEEDLQALDTLRMERQARDDERRISSVEKRARGRSVQFERRDRDDECGRKESQENQGRSRSNKGWCVGVMEDRSMEIHATEEDNTQQYEEAETEEREEEKRGETIMMHWKPWR